MYLHAVWVNCTCIYMQPGFVVHTQDKSSQFKQRKKVLKTDMSQLQYQIIHPPQYKPKYRFRGTTPSFLFFIIND